MSSLSSLSADAPQTIGPEFLTEVAKHTPATQTRQGILKALDIPASDAATAIRKLGTGNAVAAFDTVPFCLWVVAHHRGSFPDAMWLTVGGLGDRDTTCAIVAGILAPPTAELPVDWVERTEALP